MSGSSISLNSITPLAPPLNQTQDPPFWQMGEYAFQDFCRAAWLAENIECHHWGTRGQSQQGVDLRTYGQPAGGGSVGQCKCYQKLKPSELRTAADDFWVHLKFWQSENIKVFRLYVACSCADAKVQKEYAKQKSRFNAEHIDLQLYDNGRLVHCVRGLPPVVARYCTDNWVPILCGGGALELNRGAVLSAAIGLSKGGAIYAQWETDRDQELEQIRHEFRTGYGDMAYRSLNERIQSKAWEHYPPTLRGKALRLLASLELNRTGDIKAAASWVEKARNEDPAGNFQVIDALIAYHRSNTDEALSLVGSPSTVEAWNLELALLLSKGESLKVLNNLVSPQFPPNHESQRLKALALLFEKRIDEALTAINETLAAAPEWSSIRYTHALISYAATICPVFYAWGHLTWPIPSEWGYVKSGDVALAHLDQASAAFARLLDECSPDAPDHADFEIWLLAALANQTSKQADAARLVTTLLQAKPAHYRVVIWALERGYSFDHAPVRAALSELCQGKDVSVDAISALVNLTALDGDFDHARTILEKCRDRFRAVGGESFWRLLIVQVMAHQGEHQAIAAEQLVREETDADAKRKTTTLLTLVRARTAKDARGVADTLAAAFVDSQKPEDLWAAAEAKLRADDFKWVVDRAETLLDLVPTAAALRLVAVAAERAERPGLCLTWLRDHADFFPTGRLPDDLRRLEIRSLRATGLLSEASTLAAHLVTERGKPENAIERFATQFALGDLKGMAVTARLLLGAEAILATPLLQASRILAFTDKPLAIELWHEAMRRRPIEDNAIMLAVEVAHRLGLEGQATELMAELNRLAQIPGSGVTAISVEDIPKFVQGRQKEAESLKQINRDYNYGIVPVHATSALAAWPIAALYHTQLERNLTAGNALQQAPLMVRHGSRPSDQSIALEPGKVMLDVTAILLAEQIGILDIVERELGPLHISSWLPRSLYQQFHESQPHQPSIDKAREDVIALISSKRLKVISAPWPLSRRTDEVGKQMGDEWCAWLDHVEKYGGVIVDILPLTANLGNRQAVDLNASEAAHVIGIGELLDGLLLAQAITESERNSYRNALGNDGRTTKQVNAIAFGTVVFLEGIIPELLARAGLLNVVCQHYQVEISTLNERRYQAEAQSARERTQLAQWVKRLLDRVNAGIAGGRYVTASRQSTSTDEDFAPENPTLLCWRDLLPETGSKWTTVWCDDRYTNQHQTTDAGPLISIYEVLSSLRQTGALTSNEYFAKIHALRQMGVRHLPVTTEEILHFLRLAHIEDGKLQETPELAVLRMSVAAAVRDTERMQVQPSPTFNPENSGELRWLFDLRNAVRFGLTALWREDGVEAAIARSDWLFEMMQYDVEIIADLYVPGAPARLNGDGFIADTLQLVLAGIGLPSDHENSPPKGPSIRRAEYFRWLDFRAIKPFLHANPELSPRFCDQLANMLADLLARFLEDGEVPRREAGLAVLKIFLDLPSGLRQSTKVPTEIKAEFGSVGGELVVGAAGENFLPAEFWLAAAEAVNGRSGTARTVEGKECTFLAGANGEYGHAVSLKVSGETPVVTIAFHLLPMLHQEPVVRRRFLEAHPEFFDLASEPRQKAIEEAVRMTGIAQRIDYVAAGMRASLELFYNNALKALKSGQPISVDELMPKDTAPLINHLRIQPGIDADWPLVAEGFISEGAWQTAIMRLGMLPCALPDSLLEKGSRLNDPEFKTAIEALRAQMLTPTAKLNLLRLLAIRPAHLEQAKAVRDELLDPSFGRTSYDSFQLILRWTFEKLRQRAETSNWHLSALLATAWVHAARIHNIHLIAGVPSNEIIQGFQVALANLDTLLEAHPAGLFDDCAYVTRADWPSFLVRGFGSLLNSLPEEAAEQLRVPSSALRAAIDEKDASVLPILTLAQETETRPNALPSFFGGEWLPPIVAAIGPNAIGEWFLDNPQSMARTYLAAVEANPLDANAWAFLRLAVGDAPFPASDSARIVELLEQTELIPLIDALGDKAFLALTFLCAQARYYADNRLRQQIESQLIQSAFHLQGLWEKSIGFVADRAAFRLAALNVMESACLLCSNKENTIGPCSAVITKLVQASPALGTVLREHLGGRVPPIPRELARGAWPLYLALRASP